MWSKKKGKKPRLPATHTHKKKKMFAVLVLVLVLALLDLVQGAPVVIACIDGLSAKAVHDSPEWQEILALPGTSYTLRAVSSEYTRSLEGWEDILRGGYSHGQGEKRISLFEHVRNQRPSANLWWLGDYSVVIDMAGRNLADFGRVTDGANATATIGAFLQQLKDTVRPLDLAVVYHQQCDKAGHGYGWHSANYQRAVKASAEQFLRMKQALPADTIIFVVSDHGGNGRGHGYTRRYFGYEGAVDQPTYRHVPWIAINHFANHTGPLCDLVENSETAYEVSRALGIEPHPTYRRKGAWDLQADCAFDTVYQEGSHAPRTTASVSLFVALGLALSASL